MAKQQEQAQEQPQPRLRGVRHLGQAALVGIPARHLSLDEISGLNLTVDALVATGVYAHDFELEAAAEAAAVTAPETQEEKQA
jgi:hypothetical protein